MIIIKKLKDYAIPPSKTPSGIDFHSPTRKDLKPGDSCKIDSGIQVQIPEGFVGKIYPRSKMALKKDIKISAQIIHANDESEIILNLHNTGKDLVEICVNDKIAQLIVSPCETSYEYQFS